MNLPPVLQTERITARPYSETDYGAFLLFMTDPEVNYYMDDNILSEEEAEELFEKIHVIYKNHPGKPFYIWAIEFNSFCAGHLELKQTKHTVKDELEIVYMLDKKYWRQGIMIEIVREVVSFASKLGYKVIATVDKGNGPSLRLLEKVGIVRQTPLVDDKRVMKIVLREA